jgi:hypothetical protein
VKALQPILAALRQVRRAEKNYAVSSAKRIKRSAANSGYLSTGLQKKEHPKQQQALMAEN